MNDCYLTTHTHTHKHIYINFTSGEFFTSALDDDLSLEFEWQQSYLRSPGLFSVFCLILIMLKFRWFLFVLQFPVLPASFPSLSGLFKLDQLQLMLSCFTVFLFLWQGLSTCFSFHTLIFILWFAGTTKSTVRQIFSFLFLLMITRSGRLAGIRWSLSFRIFRLLSSSLLLYSQRFSRYDPRPSSGVSCRTREHTQNFEPRPLFNPLWSLALIPLTITGYKC